MKTKMIILVLILASSLLGVVVVVTAAAAPEATINVDSSADSLVAGDNECTLREAINNANTDSDTTNGDCTAGSGADVIVLPAGSYTLTIPGANDDGNATGDLDVLDNLTIDGAGAEMTSIDGNGLDRVLHLPTGYQLTLTLNNLTISGGYVSGTPGGGILNNDGSLIVNQSIVQNNVTDGGEGGGGIYSIGQPSYSSVTILESTIAANQAIGYFSFSGSGGGLYLNGTQLLIDSTTIMSNTATSTNGTPSAGGGGLALLGGVATMVNSTISSNTVVGDPGSQDSGFGGGLAIADTGINSTFSLINTTIANNSANVSGGGLWAGLPLGGNLTVTFVNTLFADNEAPAGQGSNCFVSYGPPDFVSQGHNLEDDDTCLLNQPSDQVNTDPLLGPLQDNGGPTWTHALLDFSPAIDAGDDAVCAAAPVNGVDQRGVVRPIGPHCDIGAFESAGMPPISQFDIYLPVVLKS